MDYTQELTLAITAVQQAARLCEQVRQSIPDSIEKNDRSPVTIADFGAQAIVGRALQDVFPTDPLIAEEDSALLRSPEQQEALAQVTALIQTAHPDTQADQVLSWIDWGKGDKASQRFWTLDPIDGTKGFLRGDQYAIALALVVDGEVKVGVLGCPALNRGENLGTLFFAVRGQGASQMPIQGDRSQATPIQVVQDTQGEQFRFVESVEAAHGDQSLQQTIAQAVGILSPSIRMDSQAKYGAVAAGDAVLYLRLPSPKTPNYREKIWDHAAGTIVIEEAGGRVTDKNGNPLDFSQGRTLANNQGIVASNGPIHDRVLAALNAP